MLKAALFDLDDTLITSYSNPGPAWQSVVREYASLFGDRTEEAGALLAREMAKFLKDDDNRRLWRLKAVDTRRAAVQDALRANGMAEFAAYGGEIGDRYASFREETMSLNPGAHEILRHYRSIGLKLGLVTNGATDVQRMKIDRFDLGAFFDHVQIEEEAGFGKPDGRAYVVTLAALGIAPEAAQMTGDDLVWDVLAPQRLGMRAIWYNPFGNPLPPERGVEPDAVIRSLAELDDSL